MNTYLETGIAVVLIFLLFCIVVYIVQEIIANTFKYRGEMLKYAIERMLDDENLFPALASKFFDHPQIRLLKKKATALPAYIPSNNFALTIMDLVAGKADQRTGAIVADFKAGLQKLNASNDGLYPLFRTWIDNSNTADGLRENIEKWFNDYMDRVTGWYKTKATAKTRIIAIVVACAFNLDMITITQTVYKDDVLRATLVKSAENLVDHPDVVESYLKDKLDSNMKKLDVTYLKDTIGKSRMQLDSLKKSYDKQKASTLNDYYKSNVDLAKNLVDSASGNSLVFGWKYWPWEIADGSTGSKRLRQPMEWLFLVLGLGLAMAGLSMGAPFWFDLLGKLVNVRRAGIKPPAATKTGT